MTDQTRAAFEAHFQLTQRQAWQHKDGSYQNTDVQRWWEGYQAGLAAATPAAQPVAYTSQDRLDKIARETNHVDTIWPGSMREEGDIALYAAPVAAAAPGAVPIEAWMADDGRIIPAKVKDEVLHASTAKSFTIALGRIATAAPASDKDKRIAELESALRSVLNQPETTEAYDAMMQRVTDALAGAAAPGGAPVEQAEALAIALADIRELFPVPNEEGEVRDLWVDAMSHPQSVLPYVKAQIAAAAPVAIPAEIDVPKESELAEFLNWMAERLVHVYGENPNIDFVLACKRHATTLARGRFTRAGFDAGYDAGHIDAAAAATGEPI